MFAEMGFDPEPAPGGRVLLHDCPFRDTARAHPEVVCAAHQGLLTELLARLDPARPAPPWSHSPGRVCASSPSTTNPSPAPSPNLRRPDMGGLAAAVVFTWFGMLAIRRLKNPAIPATAPTGPSATGSHIILLPKLALSCSKYM
ncbi:MAG: hypothetical protein ACJ72W_19585 [Actinoallomurus sp.]